MFDYCVNNNLSFRINVAVKIMEEDSKITAFKNN